MAQGIFEQLAWLTKKVKKLCCIVESHEHNCGDCPVNTDGTSITGDGTLADPLVANLSLQSVIDYNHDLANGNLYMGTGTTIAGSYNISLGDGAGYNSSMTHNISIGANANYSNQGNYSIAIGFEAGANNQQDNNVAIGNAAGKDQTGTEVVAIGSNAGKENTENNLIAIGFESAMFNQGKNVNAFGNNAGNANAYDNVNLFGVNASATADNQLALSTGIYNTRIGYNVNGDRLFEFPKDVDGTFALTEYYGDIAINNNILLTPGFYDLVTPSYNPSTNNIYVPNPALMKGQRITIWNHSGNGSNLVAFSGTTLKQGSTGTGLSGYIIGNNQVIELIAGDIYWLMINT